MNKSKSPCADLRTKAIERPSADHAGCAAFSINVRNPDRSGFTTAMLGPDAVVRVKAISPFPPGNVAAAGGLTADGTCEHNNADNQRGTRATWPAHPQRSITVGWASVSCARTILGPLGSCPGNPDPGRPRPRRLRSEEQHVEVARRVCRQHRRRCRGPRRCRGRGARYRRVAGCPARLLVQATAQLALLHNLRPVRGWSRRHQLTQTDDAPRPGDALP